jgi:hypothetical protein
VLPLIDLGIYVVYFFLASPHTSWDDASWVHPINFGAINSFLMHILITHSVLNLSCFDFFGTSILICI